MFADDLADRLPRTRELLVRGVNERLHRGGAIYVSLRGQTVADSTFGVISTAARPLFVWMSAGKPLTAALLARLRERGLLDWDAPLSCYLPELPQDGPASSWGWPKVTLRQLLTHTSGIEGGALDWAGQPWSATIAEVCRRRIDPEWDPKQRAAYQPQATWFLLAEVAQRLTGRPFRDLLRDEVCRPLGMDDTQIGLADGDAGRRARVVPFWTAPSRNPQAAAEELLAAGEFVPHPATEERAIAAVNPGGNVHGPIGDLGRFYEALLREGRTRAGAVWLKPESVAELCSPARVGLYDETLMHRIDWGLGLIVESSRYGWQTVPYGFGRWASPRTVGHGGMQSSLGFCDPAHGLAAAFVFDGLPGEARHNRRSRNVATAIYEDLGLSGRSALGRGDGNRGGGHRPV